MKTTGVREDKLLLHMIRVAEWRIGNYIASGGTSSDKYVKDQISYIEKLYDELNKVLGVDGDDDD